MKQWIVYAVIVCSLAALSFTPLVIPYGVSDPYLFGLPRTLWGGMLISIGIYVILVLAMFTSKGEN